VLTENDLRRTVLIVEDDDLFRKSLTTFVSSLGYTTVAARSAEEALDECAAESIGACVSDFHLPAMNGIELAEFSASPPISGCCNRPSPGSSPGNNTGNSHTAPGAGPQYLCSAHGGSALHRDG
jgi:hypothetical protein